MKVAFLKKNLANFFLCIHWVEKQVLVNKIFEQEKRQALNKHIFKNA